ncbi:uncharacterized protein DEA37_0010118 [Paragonimus westermani]|uniref:EF-hand domain-containing protein n=1 Tax=Paragonimus westermani TaxID=34504 RepID=A0A5J4NR11_9TREM|nr:uncharacterized protein DEA37_0010118 [Paragonimus westermani]
MAQESFLTAFEQIDTDGDGIIHVADLEAYASGPNVSDDFVSKWRKLFDPLNTGQITFDDFCKTLGISKKKKGELLKRKQETLFYDTNMTDSMKEEVLLVIKQHYDKQSPDTSMHPTLMQLDETFGPRWTGRATTDVTGKSYPGEFLVYSCDGGEHKYVVYKIPEKKSKKCCSCC